MISKSYEPVVIHNSTHKIYWMLKVRLFTISWKKVLAFHLIPLRISGVFPDVQVLETSRTVPLLFSPEDTAWCLWILRFHLWIKCWFMRFSNHCIVFIYIFTLCPDSFCIWVVQPLKAGDISVALLWNDPKDFLS